MLEPEPIYEPVAVWLGYADVVPGNQDWFVERRVVVVMVTDSAECLVDDVLVPVEARPAHGEQGALCLGEPGRKIDADCAKVWV